MAERIMSFDLGNKIRPSFTMKLRRGVDLAPATLELKETFALRRILLKHGQRTEEECSFVRKFLVERTTIWREPFWALLSKKEQLKVAHCVKLRTVPSDAEPHDFVAADSTSGCMIFSPLKGSAQVQCFDVSGTKLEFHQMETFGFLPVPEMMMEDAMRSVEKVKSNPRSKVFRGERDYGERRQATMGAGKIRVKIAPDGQYLSISGVEVIPMLKKVSDKRGRSDLMKSMGLELPGMGQGGGAAGEAREGRKREGLMREARYGVGSVLVNEGAAPTMVFVILEGECRIIKAGKPRSQSRSAGAKSTSGRSARYNLGSAQSSKVGVVLTSGFHTQVDVCQLGSLGQKALIGDIPALLGGVQPASVVAKTPLRVLQCRADRFAAHLDHNARAKRVYVAAAKARRSRMTERGAEVEHLMSLDGTPLLVDMSANTGSACGGPAEKKQSGNASSSDPSSDPSEDGAGREQPLPQAEAATENRRRRGSANADKAVGGGSTADAAPAHGSDGRKGSKPRLSRSTSTPNGTTPSEDRPSIGGTTSAAAMQSATKRLSSEPSSPRGGLDAARVLATASTPQLPSFSLGSSTQLAFRGGGKSIQQDGQYNSNGLGARSNSACNSAASSAANFASALSAPFYCHGGGTRRLGGDVSDRPQQQQSRGEALTSRHSGPPPHRSLRGTKLEVEEGKTTAAVAARDRASTLLASHLTPFPTITKNRSLHAVSQPIVRHSEGFDDACRGEVSRSGTAAWRVAREARYDGLVAPADRLSIVRQIEAGFGALQGRSDRVSPVA